MASTSPPRIGILGGTFDPVHVGHLVAATELRHRLGLARVLFLPAGRPPHKPLQDLAPDADRLAMLELALAGEPGFSVEPFELGRRGPSYTADTLEALAPTLVPAEPVFLMGEDALRDLPTWHRPGRIVELARLGVATRPEVSVDLAVVVARVPAAAGRIDLVPVPQIGVSSRDLRRRVAAGEPIAYQVPPAVARYIADRDLYRPIRSGADDRHPRR
ncbi:MAG: Nicotinate-nucleotide adenylyltransferase [uncultured Thermomicrobiales bacterium]|uniref:Probable nicotinate-nucleotide adenylyltransferase n=1 Tax=uncultured Thermomicrobiales bacterium TaxID=1645740 RepID=A0A6J4VBV1_9BACT|nr:MAG: Nicotinate-nucleotide adenylyltransferase [uncultured Thermomicrobiales bacterium]